MSELLPIQIPKCELSRTGATFKENLTLHEWLEVGKRLHAIGTCYQFLLGDWLAYGEKEHGSRYHDACAETGLDYNTLANYKYVCCSIDFSRRRELLSFSHHREVADLGPKDQDNWLAIADNGRWSVMKLRAELRRAGKTKDAGDAGSASAKMLKDLGEFIRMANTKLDGTDVSEWPFDVRQTWKQALTEPVQKLNEFYSKL